MPPDPPAPPAPPSASAPPPSSFVFESIGVVRSPFVERAEAPRQPGRAAAGHEASLEGRIELFPGRGFEDALDGLAAWGWVWLLFVFHKNVEEGRGWRPRVLPPRSDTKRGLFATRSPHRPNPIGLSALEVDRVEGLVVHVRGLDVLDGSPVLDLKPYVAYADAHPEARAGWLETPDPVAPWEVGFAPRAREELAWLRDHGVHLEGPIAAALALGPQPHAYRRIRRHGAGLRLALKDWRVDFVADALGPSGPSEGATPLRASTSGARRIMVIGVSSGYRPKELAMATAPEVHRAFAERFPSST